MKNIIISIFVLLSLNVKSEELFSVAKKSLESNIIKIKEKEFLVAGGNQFRSLWTRDFCHSVRGLLVIGKSDLVKSQLDFLLENINQNGLAPLYADSISPMLRVVGESFNNLFKTKINIPITSKIKPYYKVNGKYEAIDSNLMILIAASEYYSFSKDELWWSKNQNTFKRLYNYYKGKIDDGLIVQEPHSDWQDSVKRKGKIFLTNLQYFHVGKIYHFLGDEELEFLESKIKSQFYSEEIGLFVNEKGKKIVSLDGNLWAIENNLLVDSQMLYRNLKAYSLFTKQQIPGFANYPSYPKKDLYFQVKISGLSEYHGKLYWSWLMAYSGTVANKMHDFELAENIKNVLLNIAQRDNEISEIYNDDIQFSRFQSTLYKSEAPFSWGAAYILDFLSNLSK